MATAQAAAKIVQALGELAVVVPGIQAATVVMRGVAQQLADLPGVGVRTADELQIVSFALLDLAT